MGNSPSVDLGGGSAHSSRDVRTANPEKEVKRSLASRAPSHNEYTELPASLKPHSTIDKNVQIRNMLVDLLYFSLVLFRKGRNFSLIDAILIHLLSHYLRYGMRLVRKFSTRWELALERWRRWQAITALRITSTGIAAACFCTTFCRNFSVCSKIPIVR